MGKLISIGFREVWRLTSIHRWHMSSKIREQTVAEHLANVQLICMELMRGLPLDQIFKKNTLYAALMHDIDECVLGDATPMMKEHTKYNPPRVWVDGWPEPSSSDLAHHIIDLADKIDAFKFIREYGLGDYSRDVQGAVLESVRDALGDIRDNYPEYIDAVTAATRHIINSDRDIVI